MLLLPIMAGYAAGPDRGAVFGFIAGLVADLFLPTTFGLSALVGCLLGYGTGLATRDWCAARGGCRRWWRRPRPPPGMVTYAILGTVLGDPGCSTTYLVPALVVAPCPPPPCSPSPSCAWWRGPCPSPGPARASRGGGGGTR